MYMPDDMTQRYSGVGREAEVEVLVEVLVEAVVLGGGCTTIGTKDAACCEVVPVINVVAIIRVPLCATYMAGVMPAACRATTPVLPKAFCTTVKRKGWALAREEFVRLTKERVVARAIKYRVGISHD